MILVDTSVLIDFLRGRENSAVARLDDVLHSRLPYGIAEFTYLEILQGAASEKEFRNLQKYLDTQVTYGLTRGLQSYQEAARIYFRCRQKGITPRSTLDCLICQISIEHKLQLLHNDADFTHIAGAIRELQIF